MKKDLKNVDSIAKEVAHILTTGDTGVHEAKLEEQFERSFRFAYDGYGRVGGKLFAILREEDRTKLFVKHLNILIDKTGLTNVSVVACCVDRDVDYDSILIELKCPWERFTDKEQLRGLSSALGMMSWVNALPTVEVFASKFINVNTQEFYEYVLTDSESLIEFIYMLPAVDEYLKGVIPRTITIVIQMKDIFMKNQSVASKAWFERIKGICDMTESFRCEMRALSEDVIDRECEKPRDNVFYCTVFPQVTLGDLKEM